jgi:adenylate cyclase 9
MASATFNAYQEIFVSGLLFAAMAVACFLHYPPNVGWGVFFAFAMLFHILVVLVCVQQLTRATKRRTLLFKVYSWCRGWYPSHILGLILVALPVISVLSNFDCNALFKKGERELYMQLVFFGIVHFCNLTALTNWIKSGCASLVGLLVVLMTSPILCPCEPIPPATTVLNITEDMPSALASDEDGIITTEELREALSCDHERILFVEGIVCLILLLALVWLLNREFETGYRLSFHCSLLSARDRKKIQNLKNQADWLLHNIIPKHVSDQLKKTRQEYSENHHDVGIIFASLVNFNELYDESYMGGKEYLRVLNELISDFDEILDRPEFRNVEKIKTIGSTFMAASGVNPVIRRENSHQNQHLRELMDFVLELQRSVDEFNQSLIEFNLILRIGYNFGDVTAGVIGTTKLYYDIWGDAVNIASRMDSTGVEGRIQVSEKSALALNEWFDFERRGPVFVKGKDNMITYLLVGRKGEARKK